MDVKTLLLEYLPKARIMQLATSVNGQPWACNLHYYSDSELNLYWGSSPQARHSQEITQNAKVAAVIMIHEDSPEEKYVIGVTYEGVADYIGEPDPELVSDFEAKLDRKPSGLYRIKPSKIVLFDNKDFPDSPRQEWSPDA
ncbi:MAG: pyridoxamine 5'-phosphate oxidase family protein [Patescibacteria group bacterium]